jgi:hypothetical protein
MGFTGDIESVRSLGRRVASLSDVPAGASTRAALELEAAVRAEFDEGVDPSGAPWKPLASATTRKGRTPPVLTDTGVMRASMRATAGGQGRIVVRVAAPAQFHEATRPILPARGEAPEAWRDIVAEAVDLEVQGIRRHA